jgi:NADPH2:quinone reductase
MRAVEVTEFGGPDVLRIRDIPTPTPTASQVLIEVEAADTLFLETIVRRGLGQEHFPVRPPYRPGYGVAGTTDGRRVVALTDLGGYAEQAVAEREAVVDVPDGLDPRTAAALIHDGTTALGLLEGTGVDAGERVLVMPAAGALGLLLIQLAKNNGAHVVAAARGKQKLDLALQTGADAAVDYTEPDWTARVREALDGNGPDVVFDASGGELGKAAFEITNEGGRFSAHGMVSGGFFFADAEVAKQRDITVRGIEQVRFSGPDERRLGLLRGALDEAAAGRLKPFVGQTFPLERAADAHRAIEERTALGKTLLLP